jgi:hypothetical protein
MNRVNPPFGSSVAARRWLPILMLLSISNLNACSAHEPSGAIEPSAQGESQEQRYRTGEKSLSPETPPQNAQPTQLSQKKTSEKSSSALKSLSALELFQEQSFLAPESSIDQLQVKMKQLMSELDDLAVSENLAEADIILTKFSELQKRSFDIAARANNTLHKGLWLRWSEKLLFTLSAIRHFFSELALNQYEKAIELSDDKIFQTSSEQLAKLAHPEHERRLVAILRRSSRDTKAYLKTVELLATSGGPLARLNIYQRFLSEPSVELAQAIAKSGLPRVSDLVGENAHLTDGIPFVPNTRPAIIERFNGAVFRDFQNQWKELQNYFNHIRNIPARFERSREKWRDMHEQVESLVGVLSLDDAEKNKLKRDIVQTFRSKRAPEELVYRMQGIEFREGDIVLLQTGAIGGLWETFTRSGSLLSHLLMVTFGEDGLPYTVEMNFGRLLVAPLDLHAERFTIVRPRNLSAADRLKIRTSFESLMRQNVRYDFQFDSRDNNRLYCSELAAAALKRAQLNHQPVTFDAASARASELLRSAGIRDPRFLGQGSYLSSPDFEVVSQHIQTDPIALIRGQLLLEAFSKHVAYSSSVKLHRHPEAHQLMALSALAQSTEPELRRALGPQDFLFVVMTLDRLLHAVDSDAYGMRQTQEINNALRTSRITELKNAVEQSLRDTVPKHLSTVFPKQP